MVSAARRQAATRRKAASALRRMDATGVVITFESVAREAGVSRSWLYSQSDLRAEIKHLRARHSPVPEAAIERNRRLEAENHELRQALARALGEQRTADVRGVRATAKPPAPRSIGPC
ncbi:DUF6262 family protein [Kitasatospora sp. NPDC101155]|uniref:DUF6262 family protein n=1 Tax=Kitasatospora sp. NPDC101155 TaxID=3364097 RepID=UPI0038289BE8